MKQRTAYHHKSFPVRTRAWRDAEYAALGANHADTYDDRVSEDIFDVEDEYAEVDIIVRSIRSSD